MERKRNKNRNQKIAQRMRTPPPAAPAEQHKEEQNATKKSASSLPTPKRRINSKGWHPIARAQMGLIYQEVVDRFLAECKDGEMPTTEVSYGIIREMYGSQLSEKSISVYASGYKRYIKQNKLAEKKPPVKGSKENNLYIPEESKSTVEHFVNEPDTKEPLAIDKIAEIWNLLPTEFTYKQVKALVPVHISQSAPRIDTTNYIIKQFKNHPLFDCEEPTAGTFKKVMEEKGEEDE